MIRCEEDNNYNDSNNDGDEHTQEEEEEEERRKSKVEEEKINNIHLNARLLFHFCGEYFSFGFSFIRFHYVAFFV